MKEVEHKKIAVDHCSDRQPNVSPTEMNKTEPNLDQPASDVKRFLAHDDRWELHDWIRETLRPLVRARMMLPHGLPLRAELSNIHDRLKAIAAEVSDE